MPPSSNTNNNIKSSTNTATTIFPSPLAENEEFPEIDDNNNTISSENPQNKDLDLSANVENPQNHPHHHNSCSLSSSTSTSSTQVLLKSSNTNTLLASSLMQFSNSHSNFNASLMPVTPSCLLGTFEESLLNGRMDPVGIVDGFYAEIGASGSFFPPHETLPVNASFYQVCEDIAASPYLVNTSFSKMAIPYKAEFDFF